MKLARKKASDNKRERKELRKACSQKRKQLAGKGGGGKGPSGLTEPCDGP